MGSTANGLRDVVSQYQLSLHEKLGKVDIPFTYIPLQISFILRVHYFASTSLLHHLAHIITLTSLQLQHHTYITKFTSITSLHFNYIKSFNLITPSNSITSYTLVLSLFHSHIPSISPVTIHLQF